MEFHHRHAKARQRPHGTPGCPTPVAPLGLTQEHAGGPAGRRRACGPLAWVYALGIGPDPEAGQSKRSERNDRRL